MDTPNAKRRTAWIAGAAVIVAVGAYFALRGSGAKELVLYGNIDIREVTFGFRVPGRLASLAVDEGDTVRAVQ